MVRKFSFCSIFYVDILANIYLLHIFIDSKTVFISWSIDPEVKIFYSDRNRFISQEISNTACRR